jgi:hypothetical protein
MLRAEMHSITPQAQCASTPRANVSQLGRESSPIVVIDDFSPDPDQLRAIAQQLDWKVRGDFYPGPRAEAGEAYLASISPVLRATLGRVFAFDGKADVLRCYFSLATTAPAALSLAQRIPHVDSYNPRQVALVHYLCPETLGGTDFFRHRTTGFETINEERSRPYQLALEQDFARLGEPAAGYVDVDSTIFERIGSCEAMYNRAVLFPGNQLHCAALNDITLPTQIENGRLTVAAFIAPARAS